MSQATLALTSLTSGDQSTLLFHLARDEPDSEEVNIHGFDFDDPPATPDEVFARTQQWLRIRTEFQTVPLTQDVMALYLEHGLASRIVFIPNDL
jgi:hypothetical protein